MATGGRNVSRGFAGRARPLPPLPPVNQFMVLPTTSIRPLRTAVDRSGDPPVQIPPALLPEEGGILQIVITAIYTPSKFYGVLHRGGEWEKKRQELHESLADVAKNLSPVPVNEARKGTFWICYSWTHEWFRVRVTKSAKPGGKLVQVLFVDFGIWLKVPAHFLRPLPRHLAQQPAWAIPMSLAYVARRGFRWDKEATSFFVANTGYNEVLSVKKEGQVQNGFETISEVIVGVRTAPFVNINLLMLGKWLGVSKPPLYREHSSEESE